ncbi:MAG: transcriptional regulator BolA [Gammaproteobacteria bacterium]|nr:transcriptional regulator BolA [Gammaproteobacteria bacterium]
MNIQSCIEKKLAEGLNSSYLDVINESNNHNVPPGSESHFKIVVVSEQFEDKKLLARHRMINEILAEELQNNIHALAMHTYTLPEWDELQGKVVNSPPCMGGGKS